VIAIAAGESGDGEREEKEAVGALELLALLCCPCQLPQDGL
jgi:hypothetical protein